MVNNKIAEYIYNTIETSLRDDHEVSDHFFSMAEEEANEILPPYPELAEFLDKLKEHRTQTPTGNIGAIVMNCNPFTLGHRYLIETAASQVEKR